MGYIVKRVDLRRPHEGSDILASHLKLLGEGVACVQGQRDGKCSRPEGGMCLACSVRR